MTIHDAVRHASARLQQAGLGPSDAAFDADVLARFALGGWERGQLIVHRHEPLPEGVAGAYEAALLRRERREPAAYIVGIREFWELDMIVAPGVLIPRPETELVVEEALKRAPVPGPRPLVAADVGTGSGCLAVALARWLPHAQVVASDLANAALAIARRNIERHGVTDRVTLVQADLLPEPVREIGADDSGEAASNPGRSGASRGPDPAFRRRSGRPERAHASRKAGSRIPALFDLVVSNPPYVPTGDIASLQPEVRNFEPREALDGGPDGLDVIRRLVPASARRLAPAGLLIFEFGFGQEEGVRAIISAEPALTLVTIRPDYAGIPRVAVVRRDASVQ